MGAIVISLFFLTAYWRQWRACLEGTFRGVQHWAQLYTKEPSPTLLALDACSTSRNIISQFLFTPVYQHPLQTTRLPLFLENRKVSCWRYATPLYTCKQAMLSLHYCSFSIAKAFFKKMLEVLYIHRCSQQWKVTRFNHHNPRKHSAQLPKIFTALPLHPPTYLHLHATTHRL